ncbi:MAG: hypothetical protein ABL879_01440 [Devosia sp.]
MTTLAEQVFLQAEARREPLRRRPRADARDRRHNAISSITSNVALLVVGNSLGAPHRRLATPVRHNRLTRYDRPDVPPDVLAEGLDALEALGLVGIERGRHHGPVTAVIPTSKLRRMITTSGATLADLGRAARGGETIILKADTGLRSPKVLIDYEDTGETIELRTQMTRITAFLNASEVTIEGLAQPPIHLTRRFQLTTPGAPPAFNLHGRIYDGFWINMHRSERHKLRIGGERVADLDFTGMFTQLAYLEAGLKLPAGDPYGGVEGLEPDPIADPLGLRRDALKQGLNAMYFRRGRMQRLPRDLKQALGREWTATKFAIAIRKRHAPIKHLFGTGVGLTLMYRESQVLVRALLDLIDLGIPALPVHDGIMVPASKADLVLAAMRRASKVVLGVELPVRSKPLSGAEG